MKYNLDEIIRERIESGEITFDLKGHFSLPNRILTLAEMDKGPYYTKHLLDQMLGSTELFHIRFNLDEEEAKTIAENIEAGGEFDWFLISKASCLSECGECGLEIGYEFNGKIIRTTCDCLNPGGIGAYSVEIPVPSGKLIFANDLRSLVRTERDYNVNHRVETKLCSEDYGRQGMIHFSVGNSCPGVYQNSDTSLFVGNEGSAANGEIWDEKAGDYVEPTKEQIREAKFESGEEVGSICTDLWWFSAIDYDLTEKIVKEMGLDENSRPNDCFIVHVKPGVYKATHLRHLLKEDYDEAQIYSTIEWVRECTEADIPVIKVDNSLTAKTLEESHLWKAWLRDSSGRYKSFYPFFSDWLANHFCTLGNGDEWDHGVITHDGVDKPWFPGNYYGDDNPIKSFDAPSIKNTAFEKEIWLFPEDEFLKYGPQSELQKRIAELEEKNGFKNGEPKTHGAIYPISDCSYGRLSEMPYEVNDYYLAAQLTFFATVVKYSPKFFGHEDSSKISHQLETAEKILDVLYANVTERGLEERMKEIFAEFEANVSDLTTISEHFDPED